MSEQNIIKFFALARERYSILLRRRAGEPRPWTNDPIFQNNRFCCVHREDDRATIWLRENIRDKLRNEPKEVLAAIMAFRWFNKIETGEKILPFLLSEWDSVKVYNKLQNVKPIVTGAYIIKTPDGMTKLKGVLWCIDQFLENMKKGMFDPILAGAASMETACSVLQESPYLGRFMAGQIAADARFTALLDKAPDLLKWAQPGPGSTRGIGRVFFNDPDKFKYGSAKDEKEAIELIQVLLERSQHEQYWPKDWPSFEMQDIQNWNCEYSKYCTAEEGGNMKRKFT